MTAKNDNRDADFAVLCEKVDSIKSDVSEIKTKLESNYVTKEQFEPIKKIVYGFAALVFIAVITALLKLVIFR